MPSCARAEGRLVGHVTPAQEDPALRRREQAGGDGAQRRLPGAVGAEHARRPCRARRRRRRRGAPRRRRSRPRCPGGTAPPPAVRPPRRGSGTAGAAAAGVEAVGSADSPLPVAAGGGSRGTTARSSHGCARVRARHRRGPRLLPPRPSPRARALRRRSARCSPMSDSRPVGVLGQVDRAEPEQDRREVDRRSSDRGTSCCRRCRSRATGRSASCTSSSGPASSAPPGRRTPKVTATASHTRPTCGTALDAEIEPFTTPNIAPPKPAIAADRAKIANFAFAGLMPDVRAATSLLRGREHRPARRRALQEVDQQRDQAEHGQHRGSPAGAAGRSRTTCRCWGRRCSGASRTRRRR